MNRFFTPTGELSQLAPRGRLPEAGRGGPARQPHGQEAAVGREGESRRAGNLCPEGGLGGRGPRTANRPIPATNLYRPEGMEFYITNREHFPVTVCSPATRVPGTDRMRTWIWTIALTTGAAAPLTAADKGTAKSLSPAGSFVVHAGKDWKPSAEGATLPAREPLIALPGASLETP